MEDEEGPLPQICCLNMPTPLTQEVMSQMPQGRRFLHQDVEAVQIQM